MGKIIQGQKYIAPYQKAVIRDKKNKQFKDRINNVIFDVANLLGVVQVPDSRFIKTYQGYLEIIGIKKLSAIGYKEYVAGLKKDYEILKDKLNGNIPTSAELVVPDDLSRYILVFPTGTSRQFIPVWWAKQYLPNAYYAFFWKDTEANSFEKADLKIIKFFHEPGDIIKLSQATLHTITTDSFPSHLLQSATENCTVTITEVLKTRIISPAFKGNVIDAEAICHPCLHLDRVNHPLCAAGHSECINWINSSYTNAILASISCLHTAPINNF